MSGTYRRHVAQSHRRRKTITDPRKLAWSLFVDRALRWAEDERGWGVATVGAEVGVGASTIYRWLDGDWTTSPNGDQVAAFCRGLEIPMSAAVAILWPDDLSVPPPMTVPTNDPDVTAFLRKLYDPHTPASERAQMREMLRYMGSRRPIGDASA